MSRTDVHRPLRALYHDRTVRHWFADFHDHAAGPCDLDEFLAATQWVRTRCYRQPWTQAPRLCGCNLCVDQPGRKAVRRAERTWWRSTRAQLLAAAGTDRDDLDVPPFRSNCW